MSLAQTRKPRIGVKRPFRFRESDAVHLSRSYDDNENIQNDITPPVTITPSKALNKTAEQLSSKLESGLKLCYPFVRLCKIPMTVLARDVNCLKPSFLSKTMEAPLCWLGTKEDSLLRQDSHLKCTQLSTAAEQICPDNIDIVGYPELEIDIAGKYSLLIDR